MDISFLETTGAVRNVRSDVNYKNALKANARSFASGLGHLTINAPDDLHSPTDRPCENSGAIVYGFLNGNLGGFTTEEADAIRAATDACRTYLARVTTPPANPTLMDHTKIFTAVTNLR